MAKILWHDIKEIRINKKENPFILKLRTIINNTNYQIVKVILIYIKNITHFIEINYNLKQRKSVNLKCYKKIGFA